MRIARFALAAAAVITFGAGFVVAQERDPAAAENAILADVALPAMGALNYFLARPQGVINATDSIHLDYQRVVLFLSRSLLVSISLGLSWGPNFQSGSPVASWNYVGYGMNRLALGLAF